MGFIGDAVQEAAQELVMYMCLAWVLPAVLLVAGLVILSGRLRAVRSPWVGFALIAIAAVLWLVYHGGIV